MKTIKNEINFKGTGLHSGKKNELTLSPSDVYGIRFKTKNGLYNIVDAVVEEDSRLTSFRLPDGSIVRTAEHLLASIVGMELDAVIIVLDGDEVPIMDGSAHLFAKAIDETGYVEIEGVTPRRVISMPLVIEHKDEKIISVFPSEILKMTYIIDYPGTPIGLQKITYEINRENFLGVISKARTFGLTYELDFLKKADLAKGGTLDNALVFDKDKLLNEGGLRLPFECATHKIIDLLGDLALMGPIPTGHYLGICSGHGLHRKLVERLKKIYMR